MLTNDLKNQIAENVRERAAKMLDERFDDAAKLCIDELIPRVGHQYSGGHYDLLKMISDKFVERFLQENYAKIADMLDLNRIARMAELAAIGKTSTGRA